MAVKGEEPSRDSERDYRPSKLSRFLGVKAEVRVGESERAVVRKTKEQVAMGGPK